METWRTVGNTSCLQTLTRQMLPTSVIRAYSPFISTSNRYLTYSFEQETETETNQMENMIMAIATGHPIARGQETGSGLGVWGSLKFLLQGRIGLARPRVYLAADFVQVAHV
ncbi:MAG: hypothetical protein KBA71_11420, partial [Opitutaceae bacterium]|nr:hypothetical protein [Opitutaceae bacterium]